MAAIITRLIVKKKVFIPTSTISENNISFFHSGFPKVYWQYHYIQFMFFNFKCSLRHGLHAIYVNENKISDCVIYYFVYHSRARATVFMRRESYSTRLRILSLGYFSPRKLNTMLHFCLVCLSIWYIWYIW